jgi:acid stress-induced BolA-like protein IbaG/YrbA
MRTEDVVALIKVGFPDAELLIEGEDCSFAVIVISTAFAGQSLLKKQQSVLATVSEPLATGALHAMSVKCYTPDEWQAHLNRPTDGLVVL